MRLRNGIRAAMLERFGDEPYAQKLADANSVVAESRYWGSLDPFARQADEDIECMDIVADFSACVERAFSSWVDEKTEEIAARLLAVYRDDNLESCDFGACGITFDYTLAPVGKEDLRGLAKSLSDRPWAQLFPEDADSDGEEVASD